MNKALSFVNTDKFHMVNGKPLALSYVMNVN